MNCEEKIRLLAAYDKAMDHFTTLVAEFRDKVRTALQEEYEQAQRSTEKARRYCEQARLAFEEHMAAHNC